MKVLIVDDISDDRRLLRQIAERHGHEAVEAANGREGLDMARAHRPDVIISDALMPVMDGFRFLREAKDDETLKNIPFIFYSATYREDRDVDLAIALGADAYIIKPKAPAELWEEVEFILGEGAAKKEVAAEIIEEDEEYLKRYGEVVAAKLEKKVGELEKAEAEIREKEAFIRSVFDSVGEGIVVINSDYTVISTNRAYCDQIGMAIDNAVGKKCYEATHNVSRPCFEVGMECAVKAAFETGKPHQALHRHHDLLGNVLHIETRAYPLRDASGKVVSVIELLDNVTDKQTLEERLRQSQKMEAIGLFSGGIAHDFNNILTVILGYVEMAEMDLPEGSPAFKKIALIKEAGERAEHIIRQLLAFGRPQAMEMAPLDINALVNGFGHMLSRLIGRGITIEFHTEPLVSRAHADRNQMEQVLMNLALNARDAMPEGGRLTISVRDVEADEDFALMHGNMTPGRYVELSVTDTGKGMSKEVMNRVFEPFFTTKAPSLGTGLGLSTAYGIVMQHKGSISVESEPGRGTTFRIYLPASPLEAGAETGKDESRKKWAILS